MEVRAALREISKILAQRLIRPQILERARESRDRPDKFGYGTNRKIRDSAVFTGEEQRPVSVLRSA